jgi:hypothetical protein
MVGGVLNEVLAEAERSLPAGEYPPRHLVEQFGLRSVDVAVARRLQTRHRGEAATRLVNALELYARAPSSSDPLLTPGIVEAFNLPAAVSDPFDAWASGAPLGADAVAEVRPALRDALLARLPQRLASRLAASALTFEGAPMRGTAALTVRRSPEAAEVLRGLADPTRQTGTWAALAPRWLGLWAEEVRRTLANERDEFDRWVEGERLEASLTERLRTEVHTEVSGRLDSETARRFPPEAVTFDGEGSPGVGRVFLAVHRSPPSAEALRGLWRRLHGQPGGLSEAAQVQVQTWAQDVRRLVRPPDPDPFTAWANSGPVADLNSWRQLIYDAVSAAIDWDTEEGLTPLQADFKRTSISFEGQFETQRDTTVGLPVARSPEAGLALRTLYRLRGGERAADPGEAEEGLIGLGPWLRGLADNVRRQLRALAPGRSSPGAVRQAARLLAVGALFRGRATLDLSPAELLVRAVEPWAAEEEEPVQRSGPWRTLWAAFHRHAPEVSRLLLDNLTMPKGGSLQARLLDPSPVLDELAAVLRDPFPGPLPDEADAWPKDSPLWLLSEAVRGGLVEAFRAERDELRTAVADIRSLMDGQSPEELADVLRLTFDEAASLLRGERALELAEENRNLPVRSVAALLEDAERVSDLQGPPLIPALARLDRALLERYLTFLRTASEVLDQTLATVSGPPSDLTGADPSALTVEVDGLLSRLHAALTSFLD